MQQMYSQGGGMGGMPGGMPGGIPGGDALAARGGYPEEVD